MTGLSEAFDEIGIHIVADDVCAHSRQYRTDVPDGDDPLQLSLLSLQTLTIAQFSIT